MALQLTVGCPLQLINVETIHQNLLRENASDGFKKYHPRCAAFETAFKKIGVRLQR